MSTNVLERNQVALADHRDAEGWFVVSRSSVPRSARRRGDFLIDEGHLTPIPLVPFTGEVEAW